jgi:hypothetical protein
VSRSSVLCLVGARAYGATPPQEPKDPAAAIDKFLAFKKANPVRARIDIKALIAEGRE